MATRKTHSNAKAIVAKGLKEIMELMKDENNVDQVKERLIELNEAFHFKFVLNQVEKLEENVELWCAVIEASGFARSLEIYPEDSVSNVGSSHVAMKKICM